MLTIKYIWRYELCFLINSHYYM